MQRFTRACVCNPRLRDTPVVLPPTQDLSGFVIILVWPHFIGDVKAIYGQCTTGQVVSGSGVNPGNNQDLRGFLWNRIPMHALRDTRRIRVMLLEQASEKSRRLNLIAAKQVLAARTKWGENTFWSIVAKSRFAQLEVGQSRTFDCGQSTKPPPPSFGLQRSQIRPP